MISLKDLKLAQRIALQQQQVVSDLNVVVRDIDRCEHTISTLKAELEAVNAKFQGRRTTREDVAYLSGLLECAKKKLAWEKQIASLQKRTPTVLKEMSELLNNPKAPPTDQTRTEMLQALQRVQAAMERLQSIKVE